MTSHSSELRTVKRVTYTTELPVAEVLGRLDRAVNRDRGESGKRIQTMEGMERREEVEGLMHDIVGDGFTFFYETNHTNWLRPFFGQHMPEVHVYHIGNVLVAQTLLKHNLLAGLYVPPKLYISGQSGPKHSTTVVYDVPSTLIGVEGDAELQKAAEALDEKLEGLIRRITAVA